MRWVVFIMACAIGLLTGCGTSSSNHSASMHMPMTPAEAKGHDHNTEAVAHFVVSSAGELPNQNTAIAILIQDKWNNPIEHFDIQHEKLMHFIVVSKDLSYFDHIHPEYKGGGRFEITTRFPAAGDYKLIADFVPAGGAESVQSHWVGIKGKRGKDAKPEPDTRLTKILDGKSVSLAFDHLMAGMDLTMRFTLHHAGTNEPVTDLQPYLGSLGHAVAISEDAREYVHVHPNETKNAGPAADFTIRFPKSGLYKIWGQFRHHNQVLTIPFTVMVP